MKDKKRHAILLESQDISNSVSAAAAVLAHKAQHGRQQGQGGQTTKRPVAAPTSVASGPSGEINRMERAVLCGTLWHEECRQACYPADAAALPDNFASALAYIRAYEPLLFSEAQAGLLQAPAEQHPVDIYSIEERENGWILLRMGLKLGGDPATFRDNNVVLLSLSSEAAASGAAPSNGPPGLETAVRIAGIARSAASGDARHRQQHIVELFPTCSAHTGTASAPCCSAPVAHRLRHCQGWMAAGAGPLITCTREFTALHKVSAMPVMKEAVRQGGIADLAARAWSKEHVRKLWPPEIAQQAFVQHLQRQFDFTQLEAIEMAAAHLGVANSPEAADAPPFALIQGPPGTGKTHTVTGILNVWHLVAFQRYFAALVACLAEQALNTPDILSSLESVLAGRAELEAGASKPRILICAHSNAAADELLQRVMDVGFVDGGGKMYRPSVVRVGSEDAPIQPRARDVWVETLIKQYTEMPRAEFEKRNMLRQQEFQQLSMQIGHIQLAIQKDQDQGREMRHAKDLADCYEARTRAWVELGRLRAVENLVCGHPGTNPRAAREELELSFVRDAEMVFTTLSSTGRRIFQYTRTQFHTVLIDEAAQASELATLQAFAFGCKQAVLVGDPQQLPATVLSKAARAGLLERSLFERLQKLGHPVTVLSVQYRMHPAIRSFPSDFFYQGRLQDSPSVQATPAESFYSHPHTGPYQVFDCAHGKHQSRGGASLFNKGEAEMCVALLACLREHLTLQALKIEKEGRPPPRPVTVGFIAFYRAQIQCLRRTLQAALPGGADQVMVETADSFQGKQMDVIVLSCVRGSTATKPGVARSLGFLDDVRRINVAITRARRALWIVGSATTLSSSPVWGALLENARERGVLLQNASISMLSPALAERMQQALSQQDGPPVRQKPSRSPSPGKASRSWLLSRQGMHNSLVPGSSGGSSNMAHLVQQSQASAALGHPHLGAGSQARPPLPTPLPRPPPRPPNPGGPVKSIASSSAPGSKPQQPSSMPGKAGPPQPSQDGQGAVQAGGARTPGTSRPSSAEGQTQAGQPGMPSDPRLVSRVRGREAPSDPRNVRRKKG